MKTKFQAYLKTMAPDCLKEIHPPQAQQSRQGTCSAGNYLAEVERRQRQHNDYVFLSNMMTMRHFSMMNAISNMGNSGYYYTYH